MNAKKREPAAQRGELNSSGPGSKSDGPLDPIAAAAAAAAGRSSREAAAPTRCAPATGGRPSRRQLLRKGLSCQFGDGCELKVRPVSFVDARAPAGPGFDPAETDADLFL